MAGLIPSPALAGPLYGKDPWPLRFYTFGFDARCYNTLACSLVYCGHQFGSETYDYSGEAHDKPSGEPYKPDWKDGWGGSFHTDDVSPMLPVEVKWTSLDGDKHKATLDLESLFKDRLVLHRVPRDEIPDVWLDTYSTDPISPSILVEVNDRTINIYMRARVATKAEQIHGNPHSHARRDLIVAWTQTY